MSKLSAFSTPLSMTSLEVSSLIDARHDKVKQSIERLSSRGVITLPPMGEVSNPGLGPKRIQVYHLDKRSSLIVVAQMFPEFTAKVVDRWQELEKAMEALPTTPTSFAQALRLAADQAELLEKQQLQLEAAKPAVEFVERYTEATSGSKGFREVCKLLKVKEPEFRDWLITSRIMYRLDGVLTPFAVHLTSGRFEVKAGEANSHAYNHAKFTPKGVAWVANLWSNRRGAQKALSR